MVRVTLAPREVLYVPGQPLKAVHFIESGVVSILTLLKNGDCAEVGVVGREGMVGIPLIIGTGQSINEAMVLVNGQALRLGRADLATELQILSFYQEHPAESGRPQPAA